jgi:hypothetical protein
MSHNRWVVIPEECFEELRKAGPTAQSCEVSDQITQTSPDPSVKDTTEEQIPVATDNSTGSTEENRKEEKEETVQEKEETVQEKEETLQEDANSWISDLPPSYRKEGTHFLAKLQKFDGFEINAKGIISIDGEEIENYPISTLLRFACIPFNSGSFPIRLQEWLRSKGVTKFRNHLATIRPPWQQRYSWRSSTMGKRQEPSEVPKRSTNKRKS